MRLIHVSLLAGLLFPLVVSACSSSGTTGPRRSANEITSEELAQRDFGNVMEAIQRLRPRWVQSRGPVNLQGDPNLPIVFVDDTRYGSIEQLRNIPVQDVENLRFVSAADATTRHGTGFPGGIIEVRTKR